MYKVRVQTSFAAAHHLRDYDGNCENLHGHNWQIEVILGSRKLNEGGMVLDFKTIKSKLGGVIGEFDHHYLNELPAFTEANPTTENISRYIFDMLSGNLPEGISILEVTSWESEGCAATYTGAND